MVLLAYEVHSTVIFVGSLVSDFVGNSRAQKINKAQRKRANITGVTLQYNLWVSTGGAVNFVLWFLLLYICDKSHLSPLSMAAASCCH